MKSLALTAAVAALLIAGPAYAQTKQPETTGSTSATQPVDTKTFVETVMSSDQFEIKSSQLVEKDAGSGDVQAFAKQMVDDHTASSQKLMAALEKSGMKPPSAEPALLPKHEQMLEKIQSAGGKGMEEQYVEAQRQAHQEAVALFGAYAQSGDDPNLVAFAKETLPHLQEHLQLSESLEQKR